MTIVRLVALAAVCLLFIPAGRAGAQAVGDSAEHELRAQLRARSPLLATRRAAIDAAQARLRAAGLLPAAQLSAEVEEVPGLNVPNAGSLRVDVSRELQPRGRARADRAIATVELERTRLALELTALALDARAGQLLTTAGGSAAIASRMASEDSLLASAEEALRARFAVAEARYVDVLRLRTERLRIATDRRRAEVEQRIARRQLLLLAAPGDTAAFVVLVDNAIAAARKRVSDSGLPALPRLDTGMRAGALQLAMLDVRRAQAERDRARAESRSALAPSLGVQRFDDEGRSTIGLTAGISLALPFTARTANTARIAAAEHDIARAGARVRAEEARIESALSAAADRYENARDNIATFDAALLRGAREEREAALAAYRAGDLSLIELLDFERALAQAEMSRLRSHIEAAEALAQYLTAALGSPDGQEDR